MNWDAIGAIGEILGAVTVVVTLFYLSLQIRQNTKAQSISTFESAMSGFNEVLRYSFGDTERASVFRRGITDPDSLDEDENILFNSMTRHYTNHVYKLFRLYERGVFPESEWINTVAETKQIFENNGLTRFRAENSYYSDLWVEMDRRDTTRISSFGFESTEKHE